MDDKKNTDMIKIFSDSLKEIMQQRHLNITETAKLTGVSRIQISNYVNGKNAPSLDKMMLLAKGLHVSLDQLAFGEDHLTWREKELKRTINNLRLQANYIPSDRGDDGYKTKEGLHNNFLAALDEALYISDRYADGMALSHDQKDTIKRLVNAYLNVDDEGKYIGR